MQLLYRIILNGLKWSLIILIAAVTFSVSWGVFTRYVLQSAAQWTGEFSGFALVWITFLGTAYAIFQKTHIRFESLIDAFPRSLRLFIQAIFNIATLLFVVIIMVYGLQLAMNSMGDATISLPISKGFVYLVLPLSCAIMVIGLLAELTTLFRRGDNA